MVILFSLADDIANFSFHSPPAFVARSRHNWWSRVRIWVKASYNRLDNNPSVGRSLLVVAVAVNAVSIEMQPRLSSSIVIKSLAAWIPKSRLSRAFSLRPLSSKRTYSSYLLSPRFSFPKKELFFQELLLSSSLLIFPMESSRVNSNSTAESKYGSNSYGSTVDSMNARTTSILTMGEL